MQLKAQRSKAIRDVTRGSRIVGITLALTFGGALLVNGSIVGLYGLWQPNHFEIPAQWQSTDGQVIDSVPGLDRGAGRPETWQVEARFSVDANSYQVGSELDAVDKAGEPIPLTVLEDRFAVGTWITVFYDPLLPEKAAIPQLGDPPRPWGIITIGGFMAVAGIVIILLGLRPIR